MQIVLFCVSMSSLILRLWAIPFSIEPPDMEIPLRTITIAVDSDIMARKIYPKWYLEIMEARKHRFWENQPIVSFAAQLINDPGTTQFCEFSVRDTRTNLRTYAMYANVVRRQKTTQGPFYMRCPPDFQIYIDRRTPNTATALKTRRACACRLPDHVAPREVQPGTTDCIECSPDRIDEREGSGYTSLAETLMGFELTQSEWLTWSSVADPSEATHKYENVDTIRWAAEYRQKYRVCAHVASGRPASLLHVGWI